jgi:ABC-type multidrug transport system permease subunit
MRAPDGRTAWHVARNDIRLLLRDRGTVFWSFVGPFMFMLFFGFLFRDGVTAKTRLWIRNEDTAPAFATALAVLLGQDSIVVRVTHVDAAGRTVAAPDSPPVTATADSVGRDGFVLVVPAGSADSLAAGRPPHLVFRTPNDSPTPREQALRAQILRAALGSFLGLREDEAHSPLDSAAVAQRVAFEPLVRLDRQTLAGAASKVSTSFQHTVPAYLVMFLLMTLLTSGAAVLIEERRTGQLQRALVSSARTTDVVFGKLLSRFLFAWMQIAVMLGVGLVAFPVRFGSHPGAMLAVLFAFALAATGIGLLFATLFRNPDKAAGVGSLVTMAMAALGGCWWPLEIVPAWMRQIAFVLPTGWAYDGLNRVMALDADIGQIAPHLAVLLGIAAVTLPLSVRRLGVR